ncbi:hypothetical protein [Heyndrickxia sporothermodurans]|uniref:hypothetical protein n=1 Tax=Heyndrickxia sporothermodurans TaxID=46224 RepID=UPI00201E28E0|nr:hypothetical protein [Heyndrickxia sporothermodurans]
MEWLPAKENDMGIETIAFEPIDECGELHRTIGYNGILKGDSVLYKGKEYTVVMVSRLGHIGLSETGQLPYTETAFPRELTKLDEQEVI